MIIPIPTYILVYALFALSGLMVFGGIAARIAASKRSHFIFNMAVLILILADIAMIAISGYSGKFLGVFSVNPFSLFFSALFTIGLLLLNLVTIGHSDNYQDFALITDFALLGMYLVASATSLIGIFLGLELSSIPVVFAILLSRRSIEAAAKLFIMASISIAVFSLAAVMVYGSSGSLALGSYAQTALMSFAALLFITAVGFEASIFPFNVLMPDVFTGSPAYISGLLGGVNKKVGFAALIQIMILIFISDKQLFVVVAILSVLTMFYGNIVALVQRNTKRMLAYSSISQAGYMLIGVAVATQAGITATLFQIFAHLFIFIGIMAIVTMLESQNRNEIDDLIGLRRENPYAAFAMALFILSLIGLPLTTGFIGKFLLFLSAVGAGFTWLAIFGIINTVISVFYYAKILMAMYTDKEGARPIKMGKSLAVAITICLLVTVIFGIYPQPVIHLAQDASAFLFG